MGQSVSSEADVLTKLAVDRSTRLVANNVLKNLKR